MIRERTTRTARPRDRIVATHLVDYLSVIRDHKLVAVLTFVVVFAAMVSRPLFRDAVFEAEAVMQLQARPAASALLGEILGGEHEAIDAEMQVMRSLSVARGAADRLDANDFFVEENAHRPFDVLVRRFRPDRRPPCAVRVDVELPSRPARERQLYFEFGPAGADAMPGLVVGRRGEGDERPVTVENWASGTPFEAFGHAFVLHVTGDAAGRRYHLDLWTRDRIAGFIRDAVSVREVGARTGVVALGSRCSNPRLAQRISNALVDSYRAFRQELKGKDMGRAAKFLQDQTARLGDKLRRAESDLDDYRTASSATLLASRGSSYVDKLEELKPRRSALAERIAEGNRLLAGLSEPRGVERAVVALGGDVDPLTESLAHRVSELEVRRGMLEAEYSTREHPARRRLETELQAARERLGQTVELQLARQVREATRELGETDAALDVYRAELRQLPAVERHVNELTRNVEAYLQAYTLLKEKLTEAEIAMASEAAPADVIDRAALPGERIAPRLAGEFMLAALFGLAAALGAAFLREYLDRSIKSPAELEDGVGAPLYAAIPFFRSVRHAGSRRIRGPLVTIEHPASLLAENYRSLRANIRFATLERPLSTFAITSSVAGEGKTVTTINLAVVLAKAGSKVLVIDADMRRPTTHVHMRADLSPGLADVLTGDLGWRDAIRPSPVENLDFMYAGRRPSSPWALFESPPLKAMLEDLRKEYEYVLFDVPPVLAVADSASLYPSLDGVFLLSRSKGCTLDVVLEARDQIDRIGANLVGVILNGYDARKRKRYGYGAYGYQLRGYAYGMGQDGPEQGAANRVSSAVGGPREPVP